MGEGTRRAGSHKSQRMQDFPQKSQGLVEEAGQKNERKRRLKAENHEGSEKARKRQQRGPVQSGWERWHGPLRRRAANH